MTKLFTTFFALFVAVVTVTAQAQELKGDAKAGQAINAMCIGCHGIKGYQASFPEVYKVPMISGQSEKYIVSALNAYKKGERNSLHAAHHETMDCLGQMVWESQRAGRPPDGAAYIDCVQRQATRD